MKFTCPKCNNEFTRDDLVIEQIDNQGEKCFDILFYCSYCNEHTAFFRIHPFNITSLFD